ncbi:MAG TPA: hypothetical protein VN086_01725 [Candidatus Paceibacterota bacterium]|nr:hypothetical protein [Candidatus Paceibacterota bacterium]
MKKRSRHSSFYHFLVTFPDRVYPFAALIDDKRVRGRRAYDYRLNLIQERLGKGRYGLKLSAYREVFHVLGAALLIFVGIFVSQALWGSDVALPVLFVLAMLVITYQEFVLQPRTYEQHLTKGVVDWISWVAPLSLYLFYFLK